MSTIFAPSLVAIPRHAGSLAWAALGIAAAVLLARQSIAVNLEQACAINDTPYLELCPVPPATRQARAAQLRRSISASPGNARAYVQLAFADTSASAPRALQAAARVAPADPGVTALMAAKALERQDLPSAIGPLVELVEFGNNDKAALVLARLIAAKPDLVLVALGCPKQELLMRDWRHEIAPAVAIGIGASLDFIAGSYFTECSCRQPGRSYCRS